MHPLLPDGQAAAGSDAEDFSTSDMPWLSDSDLQWTLLNHQPHFPTYTGLSVPSNTAQSGLLPHSFDFAHHIASTTASSSSSSSPFSIIYRQEAEVDGVFAGRPIVPTNVRTYHQLPSYVHSNGIHLNAAVGSTDVCLTPPKPMLPPSSFTVSGSSSTAQASKRMRRDTVVEPASTTKEHQHSVVHLAAAVADGHPLRKIDSWACASSNCFLMAPLDPSPSDHYKKPLNFARFAVHVVDPSFGAKKSTNALLPLSIDEDPHDEAYTITRPTGRSLHLLVTVMPHVHDPHSLEEGFALIVACRRTGGAWEPFCLASFEGPASSKIRTRAKEAMFIANLEHCVDEASGRRIWGQRTSHVGRNGKEGLKAIRLQPKGVLGSSKEEDVCFYVALFEASGAVLCHADGEPCISRTNVVRYSPRRGTRGGRHDDSMEKTEKNATFDKDNIALLIVRELNKLSLSEQAKIATYPRVESDVHLKLMNKDPDLLAKVGVKTFAGANKPSTAVPLSFYRTLDVAQEADDATITDEDVACRIRAVARSMGWHHADPVMGQAALEALQSVSCRYVLQLHVMGTMEDIHESACLLRETGLDWELDVKLRAGSVMSLMQSRRFRASRTMCTGSLATEHILVDRFDASKVHSLCDDAQSADVMLHDRMQPLARLAYSANVGSTQTRDLLFEPYIDGFRSRNGVEVEPTKGVTSDQPMSEFISPWARTPIDGPLIDEEKFGLLLHATHLEKLLHYTRLNHTSVMRRIAFRLLEEDALFDKSYFAPGRFVPLVRRWR